MTRRLLRLTTWVLLSAIAGFPPMEARAQAAPSPTPPPAPPPACKKLLCAPTLVFQPGIMVTNAFDARVITASGEKAPSKVTPLFRLATVAPTRWSRVGLVAVVWFTPFLETENRNAVTGAVTGKVHSDAPNFLVGPNFTLVRQGPLVVQLAVVDGYRRFEALDDEGKLDQYRHNLIIAPGINFRFGTLLDRSAPAGLRAMSAYGIWQQQLTNMPYHIGTDGKPMTDRAYTPGLFFGISAPIAPSW